MKLSPFVKNGIKDSKQVIEELKDSGLYCPMSNYDRCSDSKEFTRCYNYTNQVDGLHLAILELKEELKKVAKDEKEHQKL